MGTACSTSPISPVNNFQVKPNYNYTFKKATESNFPVNTRSVRNSIQTMEKQVGSLENAVKIIKEEIGQIMINVEAGELKVYRKEAEELSEKIKSYDTENTEIEKI